MPGHWALHLNGVGPKCHYHLWVVCPCCSGKGVARKCYGSMDLVLVSDTHCFFPDIPEGDILVHCGDISSQGTRSEIQRGISWLNEQPHRFKILIAGNHDFGLERNSREFDWGDVIYLENNYTTIKGLKIYGSPITPEFYNWAFMCPRGARIRRVWGAIPLDTDILITHGPPMGIGDLVRGRHAGCIELLNKVREVKPKLHAFGHIHEGYGYYVSEDIPGTLFANVSTCTGGYAPINDPMMFEVNV